MVDGTFSDRMDELLEMIGGDLNGTITVDQVYARYQHEDITLSHPRGGKAKYLTDPLLDNADDYFQRYADAVLEDGGEEAFKDAMVNLRDGGVTHSAPIQFGNLIHSAAIHATHGNEVILDEPALVPRLSEEEIRELKKAHPNGWVTIHGHHVFIGLK